MSDTPKPNVARYTVTFTRALGDEDGQNYCGVIDEKTAIQQLRAELQEAYDTCGIAGQFNIEKREEIFEK